MPSRSNFSSLALGALGIPFRIDAGWKQSRAMGLMNKRTGRALELATSSEPIDYTVDFPLARSQSLIRVRVIF